MKTRENGCVCKREEDSKKVSRLRPVIVEDLMRLKYIVCTLCEHLRHTNKKQSNRVVKKCWGKFCANFFFINLT